MKKLIILTLISISALAGDESEAMKHIQKAAQETVVFKTTSKKITDKTYDFMDENFGIEKKQLSWLIPIAPIVQGQINTKQIKSMNVNILNGNLRPDAVYNLKTNEANFSFIWNMDL